MGDRIRITRDELDDPRIDDVIERERDFREVAERARVGRFRKFLYSSMFYTAIVGAIGGFLGWLLIEPHYSDFTVVEGTVTAVHPDGTLGACQGCGKLHAMGTDEADACPTCSTALTRSDGPNPVGLLILKRTHIYLFPGMTKIGAGSDARPMRGVEGISPGMHIRVRAEVLEEQEVFSAPTAFALRVEVLPPGEHDDGLGEPDLAAVAAESRWAGLLFFAVVGGLIALMIGAVEGLLARNLRQTLVCGGAGLGIGFIGGLLGQFPAGMLYGVTTSLVESLAEGEGFTTIDDWHGMPLFAQIVGRSLAWGAVGATLALGQGVVKRSRKLILHGLLGGILGGLIGGMLFDPISKLGGTESADASRGVGLVAIGLMIGLFIGVVEQLAKEAWLLRREGPLKGKQHVVHKSVTTIGRSAAADIYLFKEPGVNPEHARLVRVGRAHEIEDLNDSGETYVNGVPVARRVLRDGDRISIGGTVLEYRSRGV